MCAWVVMTTPGIAIGYAGRPRRRTIPFRTSWTGKSSSRDVSTADVPRIGSNRSVPSIRKHHSMQPKSPAGATPGFSGFRR
jgi:hypothetical protein